MRRLTLDDMLKFEAITNEERPYILATFRTGQVCAYADSAHWNVGYGDVTPATLRTLKLLASKLVLDFKFTAV